MLNNNMFLYVIFVKFLINRITIIVLYLFYINCTDQKTSALWVWRTDYVALVLKL